MSSGKNIRVRVLYFAQVREVAGTRMEEFVLSNPATVADLFTKIAESHPGVCRLKRITQTSLNRRMVGGTAVIKDGDEVAFMPPVTGG